MRYGRLQFRRHLDSAAISAVSFVRLTFHFAFTTQKIKEQLSIASDRRRQAKRRLSTRSPHGSRLTLRLLADGNTTTATLTTITLKTIARVRKSKFYFAQPFFLFCFFSFTSVSQAFSHCCLLLALIPTATTTCMQTASPVTHTSQSRFHYVRRVQSFQYCARARTCKRANIKTCKIRIHAKFQFLFGRFYVSGGDKRADESSIMILLSLL